MIKAAFLRQVDKLGLTGMPDLCHLPFPDDRTLDVPLYAQLNSYACGATAGFAVAAALGVARADQDSFGQFYADMAPCPEQGVSVWQMTETLKGRGVRCEVKHRLRLEDLPEILEQQVPVLTSTRAPGAEYEHWVVLYGHNPVRQEVLLGVTGMPWVSRRRYSLPEFNRLWAPRGFGIICRGRSKVQWQK